MPYKNNQDERAFRKRWWAGLSEARKREKMDKANVRQKAVRDFIANYKMAFGCQDCGYNEHPAALDFDHIEGEKALNVCYAKSIDQAKKEIEKCEVVCANCHRIRTYNRLYPCKPDIFEKTYEAVSEEQFKSAKGYSQEDMRTAMEMVWIIEDGHKSKRTMPKFFDEIIKQIDDYLTTIKPAG